MKLLLLGFGTVGQGLAELLIEKKETLKSQYGLETQERPRQVSFRSI